MPRVERAPGAAAVDRTPSACVSVSVAGTGAGTRAARSCETMRRRAGDFLGGTGFGVQAKMRRRLGVSPGPVGLKGPLTITTVDARDAVDVHRVGAPRSERLQERGLRAPVFVDEGHADGVRAGLDRHARLQARVEGVGRRWVGRAAGSSPPARPRWSGTRARRPRELELDLTSAPRPRVKSLLLRYSLADDVLAVEREVAPNQHAAARAERQAFDVVELLAVSRARGRSRRRRSMSGSPTARALMRSAAAR